MGAKQPTRDEMTEEQLERARLDGLRGSSSRTKEELAEAGRKGAAKAWSNPIHKGKVAKAIEAGRKRWWDSLPEEEKERRREAGRQAGRMGGRRKGALEEESPGGPGKVGSTGT